MALLAWAVVQPQEQLRLDRSRSALRKRFRRREKTHEEHLMQMLMAQELPPLLAQAERSHRSWEVATMRPRRTLE